MQFWFSAVIQEYETDVGLEYVIWGNDATFKCKVPSYVGDFVSTVSWILLDKEMGDESLIQNYSYGNFLDIHMREIHILLTLFH